MSPLTGPLEQTPASLRAFGRSLAGLLIVFFALLLPFVMGYTYSWWPLVLAIPLWLLAEFAPMKLARVQIFWLALGEAIGRVTTPIVMAIVFYLLVTPIGLLKRAVGASKIHKGPDPDLPTYRSAPSLQSDMSDPF